MQGFGIWGLLGLRAFRVLIGSRALGFNTVSGFRV